MTVCVDFGSEQSLQKASFARYSFFQVWLSENFSALPLHLDESKAFTAATICLQIMMLAESTERRVPSRGAARISSVLVYWKKTILDYAFLYLMKPF